MPLRDRALLGPHSFYSTGRRCMSAVFAALLLKGRRRSVDSHSFPSVNDGWVDHPLSCYNFSLPGRKISSSRRVLRTVSTIAPTIMDNRLRTVSRTRFDNAIYCPACVSYSFSTSVALPLPPSRFPLRTTAFYGRGRFCEGEPLSESLPKSPFVSWSSLPYGGCNFV